MSTRFTKSFVGTTFAAGAIALVALLSAGTASAASATDTAFLAQIAKDGIHPPSDEAAISLAHTVCSQLDSGASADSVVAKVTNVTGLSSKASNTFAVDAAQAYCPQYVSRN